MNTALNTSVVFLCPCPVTAGNTCLRDEHNNRVHGLSGSREFMIDYARACGYQVLDEQGVDIEPSPTIYCYSLARSQNGRAPARYPYWCVVRYVAQPRKDGVLTWRRESDVTEGFRSTAKAIRESGVAPERIVERRVRHNDPVTL